MSLKTLYNGYYSYVDNNSIRLEKNKTRAAEYISLLKRRNMYKKVEWTDQQKREFDAYWRQHYGRRISNKWHRIYQSINGQFRLDYIPEILYTTTKSNTRTKIPISETYERISTLNMIQDTTKAIK